MGTERDLYDLMGGPEGTHEERNDWAVAFWGIVAVNEDPEHQDRIKCVIPSLDENEFCEKWIRPMVFFSGPRGYGSSHRPSVGSEVLLFGRNAQKHNFFYISVTNEDHLVPSELREDGVRGLKHDEDYLLIADRDLKFSAGRNLRLMAAGKIVLEASRVDITAPDGLWVNNTRIA